MLVAGISHIIRYSLRVPFNCIVVNKAKQKKLHIKGERGWRGSAVNMKTLLKYSYFFQSLMLVAGISHITRYPSRIFLNYG